MEIINFENKEIRTTESDGQMCYSVTDIIGAITEVNNPSRYWSDMKRRLNKEGSQLYANIVSLKLKGSDGKKYKTDCLNREGVLRLIQSVPSPKAEPFKLWLANAGEQNIQETENPAQLFDKMVASYRAQGRTEDWIQARIRSLASRNQLTDTWREREVKGSDYAILTDLIHSGTFDMTTKDHKAYKGLDPKDKLRENMSDLELVFTTLSETLTREMTERLDARGFDENREVAKEAGEQTGESRKRLEKKTGISVVSKSKFLKGKK